LLVRFARLGEGLPRFFLQQLTHRENHARVRSPCLAWPARGGRIELPTVPKVIEVNRCTMAATPGVEVATSESPAKE
jgi:hypothetical protein